MPAPRGEARFEPRAGEPTTLPAGPLDHDGLVRHALDSSPDVHAMRARADRARASIELAAAARRPSLALHVEGLRADAPSLFLFKRIDGRALPDGTNFNDPGTFSSFEAGLGLRQTLWDGGRDRLRVEEARAASEASALELAAARAELVAAILEGSFALVGAGEVVAVVERSLEIVEDQLRRAANELELGRGLRSDVLSLEVRAAEAREALVAARGGRELAQLTLLEAAGLPHDVVLELDPGAARTAVRGEAFDERGELDEEALLSRARSMRPELEAARSRVRGSELAVREARSAWLPRADLMGRVYRLADSFDLGGSEDNWAVGIALGWDVFAGGRRDAALEVARADEMEARAFERRAHLALEHDVRTAILRLRTAQARADAGSVAVTAAAENLELVRAQYEAGRVPITRYLEAEADLLGAELRDIGARQELGSAEAQLARASGELFGAGGWLD